MQRPPAPVSRNTIQNFKKQLHSFCKLLYYLAMNDYTLTRENPMHTPEQAGGYTDNNLIAVEETEELDLAHREPTPNELRIQGKLQDLAAMAALGAATVGEDKVFIEPRTPRIFRSEKKAAFGICVGRDSGRDPHAEQPRNQPCKCGSGKKAKKCCKTVAGKASE